MIYCRPRRRSDAKQVESLEAADEGGKGSMMGSCGGHHGRISSATSLLLTLALIVMPQTALLPWRTLAGFLKVVFLAVKLEKKKK